MPSSNSPFGAGGAVATVSADPFPRQQRVVCVDDTRMCCVLFETILTRRGHAVITFDSGIAAFAWLAQPGASCDLLVTDHQMPGMTGVSLVRALRRCGFDKPILVVSATLDAEAIGSYRALGVAAIMPKPIDTVRFGDCIAALLRGVKAPIG